MTKDFKTFRDLKAQSGLVGTSKNRSSLRSRMFGMHISKSIHLKKNS